MISGIMQALGLLQKNLVPIKDKLLPKGPNQELADKVYNLMQGLKKGSHISPSQIGEFLGEDAIKPLIIADASYYGQQRKMGTQQITHFLEILLRPEYFNFEFKNDDPRVQTVVSFHDWGEDLGGSVAGAYALTKLVGGMFGQDYQYFVAALTDYRTLIFKEMESRIREVYLKNGGKGKNPTKEDLVKKIYRLQKESLDPKSISAPYSRLLSNFNDYLRSLDQVSWSEKDKKVAREVIGEASLLTGDYSTITMPLEEVKAHTGRFFEDMIKTASDDTNESYGEKCHFPSVEGTILTDPKRPSPLLHNLEHVKYSNYVKDLTNLMISATTSEDDSGLLLFKAKTQDRGDNLRTSFETLPHEYHMVYRKTLDLCLQFDRYMGHIKQARPQDYDSAYKYMRFLKAEFLGRMIEDFAQILHKRDTAYNVHKKWMTLEFRSVLDYVGTDIEAYAVENLKYLTSLGTGSFRENHIYVLRTYATLKGDKKLLRYSDRMARKPDKGIFLI